MYNIIQLTNKELGELQEIANEMGIKGAKSLERQDLIYRILDEQAIAGAQKKVATDESKNERRQRTRINKKEVANKVYSADKDKAEKINDTPKIVATPIIEEKKEEQAPSQPIDSKEESKEENTSTTPMDTTSNKEEAAEAAPSNAPKKRGRKSKSQKEQNEPQEPNAPAQPIASDEKANEQTTEEAQPSKEEATETAPNASKKRGRKSKAQKAKQEQATEQATQPEQANYAPIIE